MPGRREIVPALLATLALALLWIVGWMPPVERAAGDLLLQLPRSGATPPAPLVVVAVDDRSVAQLGPWPWPRRRLARLVTDVCELGARGVVLDLLLSEARGPTEGDSELAEALTEGPAVLAAVLRPDGGWLLPLDIFGGSRWAAHAHAEVDGDGVVRSVSSSKQAGVLALPALSVAAARLAGWNGVVAPGTLLRPDFRVGPAAIPRVSAADVLSETVEDGLFVGRVVFIGLTASGAGDQLLIPVGSRRRPVAGVLVNAAITGSLLQGGLLRIPPPWAVWLIALALATAVQALRSRRGSLRPASLAIAVGLVIAVAPPLLWWARVVLPVVTLVAAVVLSALLREVFESREAQLETGELLRSLLRSTAAGETHELPAGVQGRLRMVRLLQAQLGRDNDLRRTLLEGLEEGVVLWGGDARAVMWNEAAVRLWGSKPSMAEVEKAMGTERRVVLERNSRVLELDTRELDGGRLGLLRDVTERHELDRRRRETQRLVSHELKTPLAAISGFGEMLETYDLDEEELRRVAGMIRGEAGRLGDMVRTFLDLERLGSAQWEPERTVFDLARLTRDRCRVLAGAGGDGGRLEVRASEPAMISGVPRLVTQVIDNLVGNALKYASGSQAVDVTVRCGDGRVALEIGDDGPGIPQEAVPMLFERFFRVPGTASAGSGLGLALVKEVADWHGAEVRVVTSIGHGSVFTVSFPDGGGGREGDDGSSTRS